eukprot:m.54904 g.54904  ORF g.54904 m.54904 type:complete len:732 (-) comp21989_c0_seq1:418-2613(-)
MDFDVETLGSLSRRELQALAKSHKIKANGKTTFIIEQLQLVKAAPPEPPLITEEIQSEPELMVQPQEVPTPSPPLTQCIKEEEIKSSQMQGFDEQPVCEQQVESVKGGQGIDMMDTSSSGGTCSSPSPLVLSPIKQTPNLTNVASPISPNSPQSTSPTHTNEPTPTTFASEDHVETSCGTPIDVDTISVDASLDLEIDRIAHVSTPSLSPPRPVEVDEGSSVVMEDTDETALNTTITLECSSPFPTDTTTDNMAIDGQDTNIAVQTKMEIDNNVSTHSAVDATTVPPATPQRVTNILPNSARKKWIDSPKMRLVPIVAFPEVSTVSPATTTTTSATKSPKISQTIPTTSNIPTKHSPISSASTNNTSTEFNAESDAAQSVLKLLNDRLKAQGIDSSVESTLNRPTTLEPINSFLSKFVVKKTRFDKAHEKLKGKSLREEEIAKKARYQKLYGNSTTISSRLYGGTGGATSKFAAAATTKTKVPKRSTTTAGVSTAGKCGKAAPRTKVPKYTARDSNLGGGAKKQQQRLATASLVTTTIPKFELPATTGASSTKPLAFGATKPNQFDNAKTTSLSSTTTSARNRKIAPTSTRPSTSTLSSATTYTSRKTTKKTTTAIVKMSTPAAKSAPKTPRAKGFVAGQVRQATLNKTPKNSLLVKSPRKTPLKKFDLSESLSKGALPWKKNKTLKTINTKMEVITAKSALQKQSKFADQTLASSIIRSKKFNENRGVAS